MLFNYSTSRFHTVTRNQSDSRERRDFQAESDLPDERLQSRERFSSGTRFAIDAKCAVFQPLGRSMAYVVPCIPKRGKLILTQVLGQPATVTVKYTFEMLFLMNVFLWTKDRFNASPGTLEDLRPQLINEDPFTTCAEGIERSKNCSRSSREKTP